MKLLLFDIDGTLISTGGAGMRAMTRVLKETLLVPTGLDSVPVAGRTDSIILRDVLAACGRSLDATTMSEFREAYRGHLRYELARGGGPGTLRGVRALLDSLSTRDVTLGLLTGNFPEAAEIKLVHYDLWQYFGWGAFGDSAFDRNDLLPVALERHAERGGRPVAAHDVLVVGDTPNDVACAHAGGAQAIAVATGHYDRSALEAAGADVVLDDLSDREAFLALVG
jgi:phosphoglycolate phosphatase